MASVHHICNRFSVSSSRKLILGSAKSCTRWNFPSFSSSCRRNLSSSTSSLPDLDYIQKHYVVHSENVENGSKEYLLLPPHKTIEESKVDSSVKVASLFRHRSILFAARSFHDGYSINDVCLPLVDVALKEAGENGDQPQAIASLHGLSQWVSTCLEDGDQSSEQLDKLRRDDPLSFEAVQAIATGVPRKGHSVVGVGTYRDGEVGWKALAKEYAEKHFSEEVNLYEKRGGRIVEIEHMADQNPGYLQSAGGAMARLFFL